MAADVIAQIGGLLSRIDLCAWARVSKRYRGLLDVQINASECAIWFRLADVLIRATQTTIFHLYQLDLCVLSANDTLLLKSRKFDHYLSDADWRNVRNLLVEDPHGHRIYIGGSKTKYRLFLKETADWWFLEEWKRDERSCQVSLAQFRAWFLDNALYDALGNLWGFQLPKMDKHYESLPQEDDLVTAFTLSQAADRMRVPIGQLLDCVHHMGMNVVKDSVRM